MDITLNKYIERSNDIVKFEKNKKYIREYKHMISCLEKTLAIIKKDYLEYSGSAAEEVIKYNETTNQYYCDIDGVVLRGNIGNIYDKNILRNDRIKAHQVIECRDGNKCININKSQYCKFYHDPEDLLILKQAGVISYDFYRDIINRPRNFANTSWIYTTFDNDAAKNMRRFGSGATLEHDLKISKTRGTLDKELNNFKSQVIHDILILKKIHSIYRENLNPEKLKKEKL